MKRISKIPYPAIITSAIVLGANMWHVFAEWMANPKGYTFTGIAHYYADYFLYVSTIAQGSRGATVLSRHLFTNEAIPPTWIYWLYTLIGKFGYLGISPFFLYSASLLFFGAILLVLLWKATGLVFRNKPSSRFVAFLFCATASQIPGLGDFWFSPTPALNRLGGVPHQIVQSIFLLSVLLLFAKLIQPDRKPHPWYFFAGLALVSFLAATANPIQMLLIVVAVSFETVRETIRKTVDRGTIAGLLSVAISALLGALLTNASFAHDQILSAAKAWEDAQQISVSLMQFAYAMGPIVLFIPFGILAARKHHSGFMSLLVTLGMSSLLIFFSPLPAFLHTSPVRWLSPASYLVFPLLATFGLSEIVQFFARRIHTGTAPIVRDLLVFGYILCTIPSFISQIGNRLTPLQENQVDHTLNHLSPSVSALLLAVQQAPDTSVVMVDPSLPYDVLIPLTGKVTFTGHPIHTLYPQTKDALRLAFFSGSMSRNEAKNFLEAHAIRYVVWNKKRPVLPMIETLLILRYQNDLGILYERK